MHKCKIWQTFHWLTVIEEPFYEHKPKSTKGFQKTWYAKCRCKCGIEKIIRIQCLVQGTTKSCGCYNLSIASERGAKANLKHNLIKHPLYGSWKAMKNKCYNKNSPDYFGGNITICQDWKSDFKVFYDWAIELWSEDLVLSRRDESLGFNPENCYFRTREDLARANANPEKARETCRERYGADSPLQNPEILAKTKATNNERYGGNSPACSKEVIEKTKQNNLAKYGVTNPAMLDSIKQKTAQTCYEKFGTKSPSENPEIHQKQIDTCMERYGVPYFTKTYGKTENDIRQLLEGWTGKKFGKNTSILGGKELDMYNRELKLAVEYCGLRWHAEDSGSPRNKDYHYSKYKICLDRGIKLITIFSDEWNDKNPQVIGFLKSILRIYDQVIDVSDCKIKEIPHYEASIFINANSVLQRSFNSRHIIGLYYNNELIGCIAVGFDGTDMTLDYIGFKNGVSVIGGESELFKRMMDHSLSNGYSTIIAHTDNRLANDELYKTLGFNLMNSLEPDYTYVELDNPKKRYSKSEEINGRNFSRVWDCGGKKWEYKL